MFRKKIIIPLILVLALGIAAWRIFGNKTAVPQYQTAVAEKGTLVSTVSASGSVTTGSSQKITTSATGVVSGVYVKVGDKVYKGQKIADISLDQNSLQQQASAWSSYLGAKNQLASAQTNRYNLQATEFAANQKFINDAVERNLDTTDPTYIQENAAWLAAEANYINQASVIAQAQISVDSALYTYQGVSSTITAPSSGTVSGLYLAPGLALTSSSNSTSSTSTSFQVVGTILPDAGQIQAQVSISETDAVNVKAGQKATLILDSFPEKTFTGKVLVVNTAGAVSSGVTTYPAVIAFDSVENGILPNMGVNATIITNIKNDVVLVPSAAVITSNNQSQVRLLNNGQLTTVDVTAGGSNDTQTEIISGIIAGDTVVTSVVTSASAPTTGTTSVFGGGLGGARGGFGGGGAVRINGR
jgi:RND family efflux transporter MFP subunit